VHSPGARCGLSRRGRHQGAADPRQGVPPSGRPAVCQGFAGRDPELVAARVGELRGGGPPRRDRYSYRNEVIGSSIAARRAGQSPKKTPMAPAKPKARATARGATAVFQLAKWVSA
jgi:hypothetical protein